MHGEATIRRRQPDENAAITGRPPMRTLLALAASLTIAALTVPVLANSALRTSTDAVALLQRRVTKLEGSVNSMKNADIQVGRGLVE